MNTKPLQDALEGLTESQLRVLRALFANLGTTEAQLTRHFYDDISSILSIRLDALMGDEPVQPIRNGRELAKHWDAVTTWPDTLDENTREYQFFRRLANEHYEAGKREVGLLLGQIANALLARERDLKREVRDLHYLGLGMRRPVVKWEADDAKPVALEVELPPE